MLRSLAEFRALRADDRPARLCDLAAGRSTPLTPEQEEAVRADLRRAAAEPPPMPDTIRRMAENGLIDPDLEP